jgi:retron-type reverse transcriptase
MIPKSGENLNEVESYRPISLLPIMSKLFEKLILKRLKPIIAEKHLVPTHQFGFRENPSTIDQVHRNTDIIGKTFENKGVCSAVFLDIAQTLNRGRHRGLFHKLRSVLPDHFCIVLKSYLTTRHFRVKREDSYSDLKLIKAGVPQGSVLGPVLYLLYINDVPTTSNSTVATFADDTAVMAVGETVESSTIKLQSAVNKVAIWTKMANKIQRIQIGTYWLHQQDDQTTTNLRQ